MQRLSNNTQPLGDSSRGQYFSYESKPTNVNYSMVQSNVAQQKAGYHDNYVNNEPQTKENYDDTQTYENLPQR